MNVTPLNTFLSGAIMMASLVTGLLFFRFWKTTGDRLFFYFGIAFSLMTVERWILVSIHPANELRPYVYTVRLVAFIIIAIAIVDKNRKRPRSR